MPTMSKTRSQRRSAIDLCTANKQHECVCVRVCAREYGTRTMLGGCMTCKCVCKLVYENTYIQNLFCKMLTRIQFYFALDSNHFLAGRFDCVVDCVDSSS